MIYVEQENFRVLLLHIYIINVSPHTLYVVCGPFKPILPILGGPLV